MKNRSSSTNKVTNIYQREIIKATKKCKICKSEKISLKKIF